MNNKGTTLVEVLVSVVLIAIVMIFIFNLLSDLKNEDYLSNYRTQDSLNRTELIHLVENDLIEMELIEITSYDCGNDKMCIRFEYKDKIGITRFKMLSVSKNLVIYGDEKWDFNSNILIESAEYCAKSNYNGYYIFNIKVPVNHNASSSRKLSIDISYLSKKSASIPPSIIVKSGTLYSSC